VEDEVENAIHQQKSRAPSVSGFSPLNLKSIQSSISKPLSTIYSYFLESSSFFLEWQRSSVFFIYKGKGARDDPNNYRSICIQDPFAKVFSSILTKRLTTYAENNNLFPTFQFGFRSNRSTFAAAALLHEVVKARLINGKRTYVAYIDFHKAFDRVQRPLLFHKLELLSIPKRFCQTLHQLNFSSNPVTTTQTTTLQMWEYHKVTPSLQFFSTSSFRTYLHP